MLDVYVTFAVVPVVVEVVLHPVPEVEWELVDRRVHLEILLLVQEPGLLGSHPHDNVSRRTEDDGVEEGWDC